jgi:ribosomal protein L28
MRNRPMFPNLRKTKGVVTPEGETLTLKISEACEGEFL